MNHVEGGRAGSYGGTAVGGGGAGVSPPSGGATGGGRFCTCGVWIQWGASENSHVCQYGQQGGYGGPRVVTTAHTNLPTALDRIADALEDLVEIFTAGEDEAA